MDPQRIAEAEQLVGHEFQDKSKLLRAMTHASTVDSRLDSNERLEFLGDSVLGLVVCEHLFRNYGDLLEGDMTKIKSSVVSRTVCAEVAEELGLCDFLRLGKGMSNRVALPSSVAAAVYESIIGAIYLDSGLEKTRQFILDKMAPRIRKAAGSGHQQNFKSVLQQVAQQILEATPQYVLLDEQGPDHSKCFEVCVAVGAWRFRSCWGPTKKQAEQQAALNALVDLGVADVSDDGDVAIRDLGDPSFALAAAYVLPRRE